MINLELPQKVLTMQQMTRAAAQGMLRPIARKYDKLEHADSVPELAPLAAMITGRSGNAATAATAAGKKEEGIRNANNMMGIVSTAEMAGGCCGLMLSIPGVGLGNAAIAAVGTPEQKEKWGSKYCAMAITEPGTGSDSANVQTTAKLDGDHWVLNGEKIFCTAGQRGDAIVVWATLDKSKGKAAIKSFIVEQGTPGLNLVRVEHKMGLRISDTAALLFDNCRIPKENILGSPEIADTEEARKKAFGGVMQTFDNTRPQVAAMGIGVARAALDITLDVLKKEGIEMRFAGSVWSVSAIEAELYRMEADIEASRLLALKAAWMADNGQGNSKEAAICKAKAGRTGNYVTLRCVEILGNLGYSEEYLVEKFARDSKIIDIFEGTQQIQQLIVARMVLGLSSKELK